MSQEQEPKSSMALGQDPDNLGKLASDLAGSSDAIEGARSHFVGEVNPAIFGRVEGLSDAVATAVTDLDRALNEQLGASTHRIRTVSEAVKAVGTGVRNLDSAEAVSMGLK